MLHRHLFAPSLALCLPLLVGAAAAQQTISTFAGGGPNNLPATAANLNQPNGLAQDAIGNVYIAVPAANRIFKVDISGLLTVFAGNGFGGDAGDGGPAAVAEISNPQAVAVDPDGNVFIADFYNNAIREVLASSGNIQTVAGSGAAGFSGDGGPATSALLHGPEAVAVDAADNLYIADYGNARVRMVAGASQIISTLAGGGAPATPATQTILSNPAALCLDAAGHLFISDTGLDKIFKVTLSGGAIALVAGGGTSGIYNGAAPTAGPIYATGIFVDGSGNLFLAASGAYVVEVPVATGLIHYLAGAGGTLPDSGFGAPATSIAALDPRGGILVQANGTVLVADDQWNQIFTLPSDGDFSLFAGSGAAAFSGDGYAAPDGALSLDQDLNCCSKLATDSSGDLFFSDLMNNRVREVVAATGQLATIAGNGTPGFLGDGGPAAAAELDFPTGVAVDAAGNLFIADAGNARIREVLASSRLIQTVAGGGASSADGVAATLAKLVEPMAVALNPAGDLFIADLGASRIREVAASNGQIATIAGGGSSGSGDNGPAISAQVAPEDIALDPAGDIFIADSYSNEIREIAAATGIIAKLAGDGACYNGDGNGGPAINACSGTPYALARNSAGDIFFTADTPAATLRRIHAATGIIDTVAGMGAVGFSGDGGPAVAAQLGTLAGLAFDSVGNLYVADVGNNRLRKIADPDGLPIAAFSPGALAFGNQNVGAASGAIAVTLSNTGIGDLELGSLAFIGPNAADFALASSSSCAVGTALPATATCALAVIFAPSVAAAESASLVIGDDGVSATQTIALTGTGIAPGVSLVPPSVNFGNQTVGAASAPVAVTLANSGAAPLLIATVALSGSNAADFSIAAGSTCANSSIAAAATCVLNLAFTPTHNSSESATLAFADNASPPNQTVALVGAGIIPAVTLAPASVSFGNQGQGSASAASTVTVSNAGPGALIFSSLALAGANAADFSLAPATTCSKSANVASGAACALAITLTPSILGAEAANLTLFDNASGGSQTIALSGAGTPASPAVSLSPATLTFASQTTATTSAAQSATLMNTGQAPLTITSIAATGDFAQTSACGASLAASASCSISVTFTPTATGPRAGALDVVDNAAGSPHSVPLAGTGAAAGTATLAPASLTFASLATGSTSAAQTITFANNSTAGVQLSSISVSGDFAQSNNCPAPVPASASCAFSITFSPTAAGARTGTLTINDNAAGSPQTAALVGTGTPASPAVTLSPTSLAFGTQATGSASAAQTVTLTNSGNAALALTSIAASGDFAQTNNCPASLAAAATCMIAVTFTPTATGARTGALALADNAAASPQSLALAGSGADLAIAPVSSGGTSSTVAAGQPATYNLDFTPVSGLTGSFALACTGAPSAATCTPTPASITLSGSSPIPVAITVTTTARSALPPTAPNRQLPLLLLPLALFAAFFVLFAAPLVTLPAAPPAAGGAPSEALSIGGRLAAAAAFSLLCLSLGCGNPTPTPATPAGTPAGTYSLTITATGGGATRSTTLSLTVN